MLICNNCNTINPDGTMACRQCNMRGNFTNHGDIATVPTSEEEDAETCWNCGKLSGMGNKCIECHIPITRFSKDFRNKLPGESAKPAKNLKLKTQNI